METSAPTLKEWLDSHQITYTLRHDILLIPGFGKCLIQGEYEHIFHKEKATGAIAFKAMENIAFLKGDDIFFIVFPFGNRWFYVDIRENPADQEFHVLRWIGKSPQQEHQYLYYPLGIHSGYELLNGSGLMKDWCAKAKWLGYDGCGVSELNTMAGTLDLQTSATAKGLKFVFGYSCKVDLGGDKYIGVKIYCQTEQGFKNMLRIQKAVAVDNVDTKVLPYVELLNRAEGNVLVFDKLCGDWLVSQLNDSSTNLDTMIKAFDGWCYFQVDLSEYKADRIDRQVLLSQKSFFDNYYLGGVEYKKDIRPVLVQDMYYIDQDDWKSKIVLNKIDTGAAHEQSNRQYMKTVDELYAEFRSVFSEKYSDDVFEDMCLSTADIIEGASAAYDLTENYAPKYDMTPEEEKKYGNTLNMFNELIEEGFRKLVPEGEEERYRERVEYEKYVITSTDNVDYFLIQRDELNWAQQNGILTGIGRGSAGGCLLLYLMGITYIDPLQYDLIFERFLLPERAGLAPAKVTKLCGEIESDNYVELKMENGKTYRFDVDAKFLVVRDGKEVEVFADELEEDDDIKFDNNDLLWKL